MSDESHPFCDETGALARYGVCPVHHGDACLIMPIEAVRRLIRQREDMVGYQDAYARLRAQRDKAVEALRPFAHPPLYVFDEDIMWVPTKMPSHWIGGGVFGTSDFRRARATLAEIEGE